MLFEYFTKSVLKSITPDTCMHACWKKKTALFKYICQSVYEPASTTIQFAVYEHTRQQLGEAPEFEVTFNIHFLNISNIIFLWG